MDFALRNLPAVHRLLDDPQFATCTGVLGSAAVQTGVTGVFNDVRRESAGEPRSVPSYDALVQQIAERLAHDEALGLLEVINGTGILLHTNLGRAPLAPEALAAGLAIGGGYWNLECDRESGSRGSRYDRVTALLREFTGGATLVEVGTTNRVYLSDFERALSVDTALLLRSHPSNFRIEGFVAVVAARELAELGYRAGVATLEDLGTGALVDLTTVAEAFGHGVDLVAFSGDKLLGEPQAGVIVGKTAVIARLRANPLLRVFRVDKATLAAFGATLRFYAQSGGITRIPLYAMLVTSVDTLFARAEGLRSALGGNVLAAKPVATAAFVGGGTLPQAEVPLAGLAIVPHIAATDARVATALAHALAA